VGIVVYILTDVDHFVVDGEAKVLKITMFAINGEKGSFKDNFMIFSLLWLNTKTKLLNLTNLCVEMLRNLKSLLKQKDRQSSQS
jgi:hypothetical protein